ncbi:MAG: sigma-54 dependent transcriptional regulator [Thermodesulfobacteriota bacterium]
MAKTLVVDDDDLIRAAITAKLTRLGHQAAGAATVAEAEALAAAGDFDVVFLDVILPDGNGLDLLPRLRQAPSCPEVIIVTGQGTYDGAALAIESGAWDYVEKPMVIQDMVLPLARALQYRQERQRAQEAAQALKRQEIIGDSPGIRACLGQLAQAAQSDVSVLITGETGTGKELFARAIHANSRRAGGTFVVVDCAALPETLVESTLFGHEKGAFTGADRSHRGLVSQADGGTLFLDEVAELPLGVQKIFLRVLQEQRFLPVGGSREQASDFRLVAATNQDLAAMAAAATFRQDLLFRLQSFSIRLPPLRERPGDIAALSRHFIDRLCRRYGHEPKEISPEALGALAAHDWPGNVRELYQTLDQAFAAAFHCPTLHHTDLPIHLRLKRLPSSLRQQALGPAIHHRPRAGSPLPPWSSYREALEKDYLEQALAACAWNITAACRMSGLSRARFYQLLSKHHLSR